MDTHPSTVSVQTNNEKMQQKHFFETFKKYSLYGLIGGLIASAIVAVVTILLGEFSDTTQKVLLTLFVVMSHALVSLFFIWNNEKQHSLDNLYWFVQTIFVLIILSFVTASLGIWEIIPNELVRKIYQLYFLTGFTSLHSNMLANILHVEERIDKIIYANFALVAVVFFLLLPIIFMDKIADLGEFYFRLLGASAVVDTTLSVLVTIFYKLYVHNHPELVTHSQGQKHSMLKTIVIIYFAFQFLTFLFGTLFSFWY